MVMITKRILYRVRQFWWAITARPLSESQWDVIRTVLTPTERALFGRFSYNDQQHSYRVLMLLRSAGYQDRDLWRAALLHDIGKSEVRISVWERSLAVAGKLLVPTQVLAAAQLPWERARPWQRPFVLSQQHAAWGAVLAAEAGLSPRAVALIARHQDALVVAENEEDKLLICLQWADDQC